MPSDAVLYAFDDGLATITLNRPDKANVIDHALLRGVVQAVDRLQSEGGLRAVLLTARGRQFCAGGDIAGMVAAGNQLADWIAEVIDAVHGPAQTLAELPVPVITALNGAVGGGGIGLAFSADLVIAAESAKLRGGYSAIGLTPDVGASWQLTRLLGPMRAKQLFFTNQPLTAAEMLQLGLVAQVVPDAELQATATTLARQLAQGATQSLARIKQLANGAHRRTLGEQMALERQYMVQSASEADAREGVAAFTAKRTPQFKG